MNRTTMIVRWVARLLSAAILLFWGFFLIAHLMGAEGQPSRPLVATDYIALSMMVASLVGLAAAWKWELIGPTLTLTVVLIGAVVNWRTLTFPFILIPINAVLFLPCWWMSRSRSQTTG